MISKTLRAECERVLVGNRITSTWQGRHYRYTRPAPMIYEQQWLWDSCFHAITLRWLDSAMAWDELRAVVAHQHRGGPDAGMLPHMAYWSGDAGALWPHTHCSSITQPPLVAVAAQLVHQVAPDRAALAELYPALAAYHHWWLRRRDPLGLDLVCLLHPWEAGADASPRWDVPMGFAGDAVTAHDVRSGLPAMQGTSYYANPHDNALRTARMALLKTLIAHDHDALALGEAGSFYVVPLDFNAIRCADLLALAAIAELLNLHADAAHWRVLHARSAAAIQARLAGPGYTDLLGLNATPQHMDGSALAVALVGQCLGPAGTAQAIASVRSALADAAHAPLCNHAPSAAHFAPARYWRGNVWPPLNWLAMHGLRLHGEHALANALAERTCALVQSAGLREYFNPVTGEGLGSQDHSWTALVLDMALTH